MSGAIESSVAAKRRRVLCNRIRYKHESRRGRSKIARPLSRATEAHSTLFTVLCFVGCMRHRRGPYTRGSYRRWGGFARRSCGLFLLDGLSKLASEFRPTAAWPFALDVRCRERRLLSLVGVTVWSVAGRQGDWFHWLVVVWGIVECGEHFGVRWIDGRGHWQVFGSPRHWLGGAAGVAKTPNSIQSLYLTRPAFRLFQFRRHPSGPGM